MRNYTKEEILKICEEEDVRFIRLQFTDMFGTPKNVAITRSQLEKAIDGNCMFDGSSVQGFARIEESDMKLKPDLSTFLIFPWDDQNGKVARLICDICEVDGTPFEGDPRTILRKAIKEAADMGYTFNVGPECEFFLLDVDEHGRAIMDTRDQGGYFDLAPIDTGDNVCRDICLALEDMGFEVEASHHENAQSQHEIDFKYEEALLSADNIMTFKSTTKTIASRNGMCATFMPKPIMGAAGNGMHTNMSLSKDGKNAFADPDKEYGLSDTALYFVAGILKHAKAIAAIGNPTVNSYKRLVPGYEAPIYVAWSARNRSPMVRIPSARGQSTRIELRSPDLAANPYLLFAVCLKAGLEGIRNKELPREPITSNIYEMTEEDRVREGLDALPTSLHSAIVELEKDEMIKGALGAHLAPRYIDAKLKEWDGFKKQVSDWELDRYLYSV